MNHFFENSTRKFIYIISGWKIFKLDFNVLLWCFIYSIKILIKKILLYVTEKIIQFHKKITKY